MPPNVRWPPHTKPSNNLSVQVLNKRQRLSHLSVDSFSHQPFGCVHMVLATADFFLSMSHRLCACPCVCVRFVLWKITRTTIKQNDTIKIVTKKIDRAIDKAIDRVIYLCIISISSVARIIGVKNHSHTHISAAIKIFMIMSSNCNY